MWFAILGTLGFFFLFAFIFLMAASADAADIADKEATQKRSEELSRFEQLARERLKRESQNGSAKDGNEG